MIKLKKMKKKEKYENLDRIINKNIDKLKIKPTNDLMGRYISIDDKNDYTLDYDIDMSDIYKREYKFDNDDSILDSFSKIYEEHDIEYQPREKTQFIRVRYLFKKMKESKMYLLIYIIIFILAYQKTTNYIIKYQLIKKKKKKNIKLDLLLITL